MRWNNTSSTNIKIVSVTLDLLCSLYQFLLIWKNRSIIWSFPLNLFYKEWYSLYKFVFDFCKKQNKILPFRLLKSFVIMIHEKGIFKQIHRSIISSIISNNSAGSGIDSLSKKKFFFSLSSSNQSKYSGNIVAPTKPYTKAVFLYSDR